MADFLYRIQQDMNIKKYYLFFAENTELLGLWKETYNRKYI